MMIDANWQRRITTSIIYLTYVCWGCLAIGLPTISPDLELVLDITQDQMKYGVTGSFVVYALAALSAGYVFKVINRTICLIFFLIVAGLAVGTCTVFKGIFWFCFVKMTHGFCGGFVDTIMNVWILELWAG